MRGSTRKRGATWTAYWDLEDLESGKRKQKSKGGYRTQKEAQAHLDEVVPAVKAGTYLEPSKRLLGRYLLDESAARRQRHAAPSHGRALHEDRAHLRRQARYRRRAAAGALRRAPQRLVLGAGARGPLTGHAAAHARSATPRAQRCGSLGHARAQPRGGSGPPAIPRSRVQAWSARELRIVPTPPRGRSPCGAVAPLRHDGDAPWRGPRPRLARC